MVVFQWLLFGLFLKASEAMPNYHSTPQMSYKIENLEANYKEMEMEMMKKTREAFQTLIPLMMNAQEDDEGPEVISPGCITGITKLVTGLTKLKKAPIQLLDSIGKPRAGLLYGGFPMLGDKDECLGTIAYKKNNKDIDYNGMYCTIGFSVAADEAKRLGYLVPSTDIDPPLQNITTKTEVMNWYKVLSGNKGDDEYALTVMSLCLPSPQCQRTDVDGLIKKVRGKSEANLFTISCVTNNDNPKMTTEEIVISSMLGTFVFFVVVGTLFEFYCLYIRKATSTDKNSESENMKYAGITLLLSFSLITNGRKLLSTDGPKNNPVSCFNGLRFCSMCWVVLGHSILSIEHYFMRSPLLLFDGGQDILMMGVYNGYFSVDTFFFMTGVLFAYLMIQAIQKYGSRIINPFVIILKRIIRLLPLAIIVMGIRVLLPVFSFGPIGHYTLTVQAADCYKNWWHVLVYAQGYIDPTVQCNLHLWYITVDMHLYIAGIVYVVIYAKNPRLAHVFNGVFMFTGVLWTAIIVIVKNWPVVTYVFKADNILISEFFHDTYMVSHTHFPVFGIGLAVGTYLANTEKPNINLSKCSQILGWITCFFSVTTPIFIMNIYFLGHRSNMTEAVIYHSMNKLVFSLGLAWITLMCASGKAGVLTRMLSWKGFIPLNKPSLALYLIHMLVMKYLNALRTAPMDINNTNTLYLFMGYVFVGYICATIFHLVFECPLACIERLVTGLFLSKRTNKSIKTNTSK